MAKIFLLGLPSCKDAVCPVETVCVNQKTSRCAEDDGECQVDPKCIFLKDPSTSTPSSTQEVTSSPTSSGTGPSAGSALGDAGSTPFTPVSNTLAADDAHHSATTLSSVPPSLPATTSEAGVHSSNALPVGDAGGVASSGVCGRGLAARRCNEASEICAEVAVLCAPAPVTGKLSCRYEDRCIPKGE
jgi:hypothetical protein